MRIVGASASHQCERTMNEHDKTDSVSRRRVLHAAAEIVPLHVGSRGAAAIAPFGMSRARQQSSNGQLALGRTGSPGLRARIALTTGRSNSCSEPACQRYRFKAVRLACTAWTRGASNGSAFAQALATHLRCASALSRTPAAAQARASDS